MLHQKTWFRNFSNFLRKFQKIKFMKLLMIHLISIGWLIYDPVYHPIDFFNINSGSGSHQSKIASISKHGDDIDNIEN